MSCLTDESSEQVKNEIMECSLESHKSSGSTPIILLFFLVSRFPSVVERIPLNRNHGRVDCG